MTIATKSHATSFGTRLPILVGVLAGMVVWFVLGYLESPAFYSLSVWFFGETSPKQLFATPGYYCIHRTLLLLLCAAGGGIGVAYSQWPTVKSVLFLFGLLIVVAVFLSIFPR